MSPLGWWRRWVESRYFERRTVVIAVGTKADGSWQAAGASALAPATKRLLATSNGEAHVCWVEVEVWFPKEPALTGIAGLPEPVGPGGSGVLPPQVPTPHPLPE